MEISRGRQNATSAAPLRFFGEKSSAAALAGSAMKPGKNLPSPLIDSPRSEGACEGIDFTKKRHSGAVRRAEPGTQEHRHFQYLQSGVHGFRARGLRPRPGMTRVLVFLHTLLRREDDRKIRQIFIAVWILAQLPWSAAVPGELVAPSAVIRVWPGGGKMRENKMRANRPMSVRSLMIRGAAAALMLALAGCGGPPWVLSQSPNYIALRWYTDSTPSVAAVQLAQLHCRSWGKSAELTTDAKDGSDEVAQFRCR